MKRSVFTLSLGLFFIPLFALTYSDDTTHPALTQEIVKLFNQSSPDRAITNADVELVIQGSIDEDRGTRWMHHFYDPVYNRGLVFGKEWTSSKEWSQDTMAQAGLNHQMMAGTLKSYFGGADDYSWERAIYEYAWSDKKRGLLALGHALHLLEDVTVPDHTRNDPHPPVLDMGSPYEGWTKKFDRTSIRISGFDELKPVIFATLNDYFEALANYSNNNFFSEDRIFSEDYSKPIEEFTRVEEVSPGIFLKYGLNRIQKEDNHLVLYKPSFAWRSSNFSKKFTLDDEKILSDYWSHLSKQAVAHGAGAVKLFFDEVEKEKETKTLYEKNRSWLAKKMDNFTKGMFGITAALYGSSVRLEDVEEGANIVQAIQQTQETTPEPAPVLQQPEPAPTEDQNPAPVAPAPIAAFVLPPQATAPRQPAQTQIQAPITQVALATPPPFVPSNTSSFLPFAGGGGESAATEKAARQQENQQSGQSSPPPSTPAPTPDTTPPAAPIVSSPANSQTLTTTSIIFTGIAEALAAIKNDFSSATTSVSSAGSWSLTLSGFSQGTTTLLFSAVDSAGNTSATTPIALFVDSGAPDISLTITQCANSLSPDACLVATTTIAIAWSSAALDVKNYSIECEAGGSPCPNFNFSETTATTTTYSAPSDNTAYTFRAKVIDRADNQSAQETKTVGVITRPLVINEVAWAGTSATRDQDEWIELYNPTSRTIALSGITLRSETDNKPNIALSGAIGPRNFYLIERTDDATISDITASTTAAFGSGSGVGLFNNGEVIVLEYASATLDKTPLVSLCSGWCGGISTNYYHTMERYDPNASGENPTNWGTWASFLGNGLNADNAPIKGTPGKRNSISYYPDKSGGSLGQNKTLSALNSPYIIPLTFTVQASTTLTIEPGVVIKFFSTPSMLLVNGALSVRGTPDEPVVFTSFKDDSYGGDTNQDGSVSSPQAGDWGTVKITADGSVIDRTVFRYGGYYDYPFANARAILRVENASTTVANSAFEYSGGYGVWYKNASGTFSANTVRNNRAFANTDSTGMTVEKGNLTIQNNVFENNHTGLSTTGTGAGQTITVSGNTFLQNTSYAVQSINAYPIFSGNTASGNGINGINVQGTAAEDYTLRPDLPYVIQNTTYGVSSGKTLTLLPGVVIKLQGSGGFRVQGRLVAQGAADQKIVFTSLHDDEYGGDTNSATTQPQAGDWHSVWFDSGNATSTLSHAVLRFGGTTWNLAPDKGAIRVENAFLEISGSLIEKNYVFGIRTKNSTVSIINSFIQNHLDPPAPEPVYGVFLTENSRLILQSTAIKNNRVGISADGSSSVSNLGGITFEGNTTTTTPANLLE